jgi:hypothetical protein
MFDLDKLEPIIAQQIAAKIIAGISEEDRDNLLSVAVAKALGEWNFKHAVEKAVCAKSSELSAAFLMKPEQEERLQAAIERGFAMYLEALPRKIFAGLCEMMHGKQDPTGNYHQPGSLLRLLGGKS